MQLTYDELYKIFHGESTNWKEFDNGQDLAISVYVHSTNSARGELFNEEVMDGREFSASAHTLVGQELLKAVAADPQAIGFGPLATMGGLKPLGIKRAFSSTPVLPTEDNLSKQIYPITRCLFSYCNPTAKAGDLKPYLDWIRSDEGQAVARAAGFYPLPAGSRSRQ
jgi:ABC-type phosphate transport system substrate-binding protein